MHPTLKAAIDGLNRARRELDAVVRAASPLTYEEWKAQRLERVASRCGGNPTFIGSRIQPCDVYRLSLHDKQLAMRVAPWQVSVEDVRHAKRFCVEEPHWQMLRGGYDHLQDRELTDDEYEALRAKWKLAPSTSKKGDKP